MGINNFMRKIIIIVFAVFSVGILALSIGLYAAHGVSSRELLEESVMAQLSSTVVAATHDIESFNGRDGYKMTDFDSFGDYFENFTKEDDYYSGDTFIESKASEFTAAYKEILATLRELATAADVDYIYAIRITGDNEYRLIYDTDTEEQEPFCEYENLTQYQPLVDAFRAGRGTIISGILNVEDEWGKYSTAAAPIFDGNTLVGIVGVDILAGVLEASTTQFVTGIITLTVVLTSVLLIFGAALLYLLNHIRRIQDNLRRMAHYDKLTDLPNRRYLLEQLAEMTIKKPGEPFALLFIDLDNFKKVNDNAGHDAGDELLRHIASYLSSAHRNSKVFRMSAGAVNVTARVGGDEFIMIANGLKTEEEAGEFAQELLNGFAREHIDKYIEKYDVGLSIGVSLYPGHISDFHALINYADTAMYYAKKAGKNTYRVYNDEMNKKED